MGVVIKKAGFFSTIQDLGRNGYQGDGIIVSGAMDRLSMRLANLLLGNNETDAVIEVTMIGPTLEFSIDTIIAVCGADLSPSLNLKPIPLNKPIIIKSGDLLQFGQNEQGCRCYIAVKGGIQVPSILGSKSTNIPAEFGGLQGRPLKNGDSLPIHLFSYKNDRKIIWQLSDFFHHKLYNNAPIRYIKGRQYDLFNEKSKSTFNNKPYRLTNEINRMGYRLEGAKLQLSEKIEILTEGVTFGSVQVPANGQPIILMADHQTTGGYPKIAQIISTDLPRLAQLKPGDEIYFKEISIDEAQQLALSLETELTVLQKTILAKWKDESLNVYD